MTRRFLPYLGLWLLALLVGGLYHLIPTELLRPTEFPRQNKAATSTASRSQWMIISSSNSPIDIMESESVDAQTNIALQTVLLAHIPEVFTINSENNDNDADGIIEIQRVSIFPKSHVNGSNSGFRQEVVIERNLSSKLRCVSLAAAGNPSAYTVYYDYNSDAVFDLISLNEGGKDEARLALINNKWELLGQQLDSRVYHLYYGVGCVEWVEQSWRAVPCETPAEE